MPQFNGLPAIPLPPKVGNLPLHGFFLDIQAALEILV